MTTQATPAAPPLARFLAKPDRLNHPEKPPGEGTSRRALARHRRRLLDAEAGAEPPDPPPRRRRLSAGHAAAALERIRDSGASKKDVHRVVFHLVGLELSRAMKARHTGRILCEIDLETGRVVDVRARLTEPPPW